MHREGVQEQNLPQILALLKEHKQLELEGLMSDLHSADTDDASIQKQVTLFKKMGNLVEQAGFAPKWKHI